MNKISNALKCVNCQTILKAPVLLPCEHSICKHHLEKCENNEIECLECHEKHAIPEKVGFPFNRPLAEIIEAQIQTLIFGKNHQEAHQSCGQLEKLSAEVGKIVAAPTEYTENEIGLVKKVLEEKRTELKSKIDKEVDKMLRSLDDLGEKSKKNVDEDECKTRLAKLEELNEAVKTKLAEWQAALDQLSPDDEKWLRIKYESDAERKRLDEMLRGFKQVVLFNDFENIKQFIFIFRKINFEFKYE